MLRIANAGARRAMSLRLISPEAIEAVLAQFEGVIQAAAVALPNAFGNNEVCAVVVMGGKVDEQKPRAHCESRIGRPYAPVKYIFVDKLSRNENGKLDRRRLNDMLRHSSSASS
jgi:acyl-coenzyme A synthetase/AMP-(fatty) acid ligase